MHAYDRFSLEWISAIIGIIMAWNACCAAESDGNHRQDDQKNNSRISTEKMTRCAKKQAMDGGSDDADAIVLSIVSDTKAIRHGEILELQFTLINMENQVQALNYYGSDENDPRITLIMKKKNEKCENIYVKPFYNPSHSVKGVINLPAKGSVMLKKKFVFDMPTGEYELVATCTKNVKEIRNNSFEHSNPEPNGAIVHIVDIASISSKFYDVAIID